MIDPATFSTLVRKRRQDLRMSQDGLVARMGPLPKDDRHTSYYEPTGLTVDILEQLENQGTVHVHMSGYASLRLAAALELPMTEPSPLFQELLENIACALGLGYVSVRAATDILRTSEEELQEAFNNNKILYSLYSRS